MRAMRRVVTTSCASHGQEELAFEYDSSVVVDADASSMLAYLEREVASGRRFEAKSTIQLGWNVVVLEDVGDCLELTEPDWSGKVPMVFVRQLTRALSDARIQRETAASLGLEGSLLFTNIIHSGIVCRRVGEGGALGVMERVEPEGTDSGWFFGCADSDHDHNNPKELERQSLYAIACRLRDVVPYCALPPNIRIEFDGSRPVSFAFAGLAIRPRKDSFLHTLLASH